ncbi:hypothetical protein BDC45DRAFT_531477 [Circinella umbellata]|nr:hypothetical protein BDC45DRAFT_531477 [Circinella umbellata]
MCEPPIMVKKKKKKSSLLNTLASINHIYDTPAVIVLDLNLGLHSWADILRVKFIFIPCHVDSVSHSNALPAVLAAEIDLLYEHCAATYLSANAAKILAYVQHQNDHSSFNAC